MKYTMLIHQVDARTPRSPEEWATLSEDEQKAVHADYQAINETPRRHPGPPARLPRDGHHRASAGRQD